MFAAKRVLQLVNNPRKLGSIKEGAAKLQTLLGQQKSFLLEQVC